MSDLISRQAAVEEALGYLDGDCFCDETDFGSLINDLENLPSAGPEWTEIFEDDEKTFPPVDEEGYSDYILVSFENFTIPLIGRYQVDDQGGAFYAGNDEEPALSHGLIVNAWMPLPAPFRPKEDES